MRVLFVDDHEVIWSGMKDVVERLHAKAQPDRHLQWFCARSLPDALNTEVQALELILLDYHLPGTDCQDAMRALRDRFESAPTVIVSGDSRPDVIRSCIEAGAAGYLPKSMRPEDMLAALGLVLAHGIYLPVSALQDSSVALRGEDEPHLPNEAISAFMASELSPRQREVFARALRGKANKVIARELDIAEGTVKVHLAMVFRALGVHNRTEAMYRVLSADAAAAVDRL